MKTPPTLLPDLPTLRTRLTAALNGGGMDGPAVTILERKLPRMMSTYPNEIVTCRLPGGNKRRLFIKYEAGHNHNSFGHRGGIAYEAEVYRRILRADPGFRPKCLGQQTNPGTGETWLILEYIDRCVRVSDISVRQEKRQPLAMAMAARWLGGFHAEHETELATPGLSFLNRYDAQYYDGWARRTAEFAGPLHARFPWLKELCESGQEWFGPLLRAPQTAIHGEFYAKTVLLRREMMYVVDWESAALAPGEIDLAALTEGTRWPKNITRRCEREYQRARWSQGAPLGFKQTLNAARIYLHFRWLGERPDWTVREKSLWRYEHLRAAAKRLGLL